MKKFLAIAVVAIAFTACNDDKKTEEVSKDTSTVVTAMPADTNTVVTTTTVTTDTMNGKMAADTMKK